MVFSDEIKSKVRGSSRECQAAMVQEGPRGATPHPRSKAAAGRRHPVPKARGGGLEELSHIEGQEGRW